MLSVEWIKLDREGQGRGLRMNSSRETERENGLHWFDKEKERV